MKYVAPPITAYDKSGILINESSVQFHWYKMSHTKSGYNQWAAAEVGTIGEQLAKLVSEVSELLVFKNANYGNPN